MYVKKLRIDGVRGFYESRAVDLDFTRPDGGYAGWTVIAGRNGSGKTALLQAIALSVIGEKRAALLDGQLEEWLSFGCTRGQISLWLELDTGQESFFPEDSDIYVDWRPEQPTLFDNDYQETVAATEVVFGSSAIAQSLWSSKPPRGGFLLATGRFADWPLRTPSGCLLETSAEKLASVVAVRGRPMSARSFMKVQL
ncbi:AAA family ATPase [Streptomyces pratensis]|nr:AAA family ATPase [Streptomyces pratensis]